MSSITAADPTRPASPTRPARPPHSRRTGYALAVAVGLIATTTAIVGVANLVTDDPATGRGSATRDHSSQPCRLSARDVANWGETSTHLPQACSDGV
jgi:hypothetical protein